MGGFQRGILPWQTIKMGLGSFAINLAPLLFPSTVELDPSSVSGTAADGTPLVQTAQPLFDGLSEITAFGNATRITIVDETLGDATYGEVIGGFDTSNVSGTNIAANWTDAFGNFSIPVNAGAFTTNGLKTVELYATDNAGSVSNKITLQFTLNVPNITPPTVPVTPTLELAPYDVTGAPGYTNIATPNFIGVTSPNVTVGLLLNFSGTLSSGSASVTDINNLTGLAVGDAVTGTGIPSGTTILSINSLTDTITLSANATASGLQSLAAANATATSDSNGNFTLTFPNPTSESGTFTVEAIASNKVGSSGISTPVTFTILIGQPSAPSNFSLKQSDDSGIVGDNITDVRKPHFIGTAEPNVAVELFEQGIPTIWATTTTDIQGNFSVQLPFNLTNGQISLYVEVTDLAGNLSNPSNTLTITVVSTVSDYNYNSQAASNPALFSRDTTDNQLQWLVQTAAAAPPPWFGSSGVTYAFGPSDAVPFPGDFDGDGYTDLAYYQLSTAKWYLDDSTQGTSSFQLGTPNSSLPVVGYFNANAPEEVGAYTVVNGQGVWTIASSITGLKTVTFPQVALQGDTPVPGDYLGLGYDQIAIYRGSTGQFLVLNPTNGQTVVLDPFAFSGTLSSGSASVTGINNLMGLAVGNTVTVTGIPSGTTILSVNSSTDTITLSANATASGAQSLRSLPQDLSSLVPVPGAYDNLAYFNAGETEQTEAAVYDPTAGVFTILGPNGVYTVGGFEPGDIPAPADYSGSGSIQPVVYRPNTGQFIGANATVIATFGQSNDIPLTAPLSYRLPSSDPPASNATQLSVQTQPLAPLTAGTSFKLMVAAEDQYGNLDSSFVGHVSVALPPGSSATLGGTTTVVAIKGVATFSGLTLSPSSSPVSLLVTSTGLKGTMTNPISIASPPTSTVAALPATTTTASFTVSWSGSDGQGPGIASYNIYVSDNGGSPTLWQSGTTKTSATYTGQAGHTYGFYSVATDNLGLVQPTPASAQATTEVVLTQPPLPLVTMTNVQDKTNSKHRVTQIILTFSGAVNMTEAQSASTYELIEANKKGLFTGKGAKVITVKPAVYNAADDEVTLTPAVALTTPVELIVYGTGPNGLHDSQNRYIDGNHDGVAGGNAVAILKKGGVTINAVPAGPLAIKRRGAKR